MRNRITALLAGVAILLGLGLTAGTPAQASALTPERMTAISAANIAVQGNGWSFTPARAVANLPETPVAAAKRAQADCDWDTFCMWVDINWTGKMWAFSYNWLNAQYNGSFSLRSSSCGAPNCINNQGSSWVNNYNRPNAIKSVYLFDDSFCDYVYGLPWFRQLGYGVATAQGSDWNDRVSGFGFIDRSTLDC